MSEQYRAQCGDCGHAFTFFKGDLMRSLQTVCDTCGDVGSIPRYAPIASDPMGEGDLAAYLAFDSRREWPRSGRGFSLKEKALIHRLGGFCQCGGQRRRVNDSLAKFRCPRCKSDRLEGVTATGMLSD